ncbi:serine/threonine protein kinase [Murinocardiopsis flavida]|uniref:non-specific serine/threonine protein kinase n=1 Tax=Murinocardiopsis flavida TaxID=645275 RepID=A0A2P8CUY7_9ACTN|nr:serine/threonine-protein kinase [Murinocardiopsis flavida]PSK88776.1 serine/threonine protein kinase [Murinocardiopsis flavida]
MTTEDPEAHSGAGRLLAGRYRMTHLLGEGGMGRVWQGSDELLDRPVAIKELTVAEHLPRHEVEILRTRMLREARSAAQLSHPSIITVFDVVEEDSRPWIVMELVRGPSLSEILKGGTALPPARAAKIGLQMTAALAVAHERGIVHRDIKPGNVLIAPGDRAVLTDFGIARLEGSTSLTSTGLLLGSPSYLAPEQARGEMANAATDIWALGVTLYQAVEGAPPFHRNSPMATLTAIVTEDVPPPIAAGPLHSVLVAMLDKDPGARPDVATVRAELEQIVHGADPAPAAAPAEPAEQPGTALRTGPPGPPRPPGPSGPARTGPARPAARTLLLVVGAVLALALAIAGGVWLASPGGQGADPAGAQGGPGSAASETPSPKPEDTEEPEEEKEPEFEGLTLTRHEDETGFSLEVPEEWKVERKGSSVFFRNPEGGYLQVDQTDTPGDDAKKDWEQQAGSAPGRFSGYDEVGIENNDDPALADYKSAADWEFTFKGDNGKMHAVNRGFHNDAKGYALFLVATEDDFPTNKKLLDHMTETFTPAGG